MVLRNVVSNTVYKHFLTLTVALSMMLDSNDERRNAYLEYANELLVCFVQNCLNIYGDTFTVFNVHGLIHLHEDVNFFKCSLNDISAFQFENYLQTLKKHVRQGLNPVAQVAKRLTEIEKSNGKSFHKNMTTYISEKTDKDSCFLLHNEEFAFVKEKRADPSWSATS